MVAAASRTPFEATRRVFVLERADTMNDAGRQHAAQDARGAAAATSCLILLTDRPTQVLPTITLALPARALRRAAAGGGSPSGSGARASRPSSARAARGSSLGDGERALALALGDGPALRARAEAFARAALSRRGRQSAPWRAAARRGPRGGDAAEAEVEAALATSSSTCPRRSTGASETEFTERARRAARRAETGALDHALQLVGLWYRDVACVAADAEELVHHIDRLEPARDADGRDAQPCTPASSSSRTRARGCALTSAEELALRGARLPARATLAGRSA